MNDNNFGQGQFEYIEISNSVTDSRTLDRLNVYNLELINNTAFEIQVVDRDSGDVRVPANDRIRFNGNPFAPVHVRYKVRFNVAAPTTDFIIIILSQVNSYGNSK